MKKLLFSVTKKDLEISNFCSGGPGGQHQNKVATGARVKHKASGAVGESRDHKSQHANIKAAFMRMTQTKEFKLWHRLKTAELIEEQTIEEKVDKMLISNKLKIEVKDEKGRWIVTTDLQDPC